MTVLPSLKYSNDKRSEARDQRPENSMDDKFFPTAESCSPLDQTDGLVKNSQAEMPVPPLLSQFKKFE